MELDAKFLQFCCCPAMVKNQFKNSCLSVVIWITTYSNPLIPIVTRPTPPKKFSSKFVNDFLREKQITQRQKPRLLSVRLASLELSSLTFPSLQSLPVFKRQLKTVLL